MDMSVAKLPTPAQTLTGRCRCCLLKALTNLSLLSTSSPPAPTSGQATPTSARAPSISPTAIRTHDDLDVVARDADPSVIRTRQPPQESSLTVAAGEAQTHPPSASPPSCCSRSSARWGPAATAVLWDHVLVEDVGRRQNLYLRRFIECIHISSLRLQDGKARASMVRILELDCGPPRELILVIPLLRRMRAFRAFSVTAAVLCKVLTSCPRLVALHMGLYTEDFGDGPLTFPRESHQASRGSLACGSKDA
ncbi:hypothetical protein BDK51DRAFT_51120 [Blyttiomyces helicus]|uniref:F-box domain-containing protein n=1 Tax=Blyttiomyces helicus TaxID=388810 RepID=A0A4P9WBL9_9FUNG|nr:hypothetical protein BDK51DRAFT_51120 [Blyttiomyces helicus]|eukprot:RKO88953.1 hypothetical protein BDK51DRAFT_51120 [Blyttiomyces helicus]